MYAEPEPSWDIGRRFPPTETRLHAIIVTRNVIKAVNGKTAKVQSKIDAAVGAISSKIKIKRR